MQFMRRRKQEKLKFLQNRIKTYIYAANLMNNKRKKLRYLQYSKQ